ncbi:MAG TPA: hypothetical protein VGZ52_12065 [Acidimicrobiales bacterium]|nr:hypothetical protein [Acidimicrobiales bacterium]
MAETTGDRSCGPSGCEVTWLTSARLEVADDDPVAFTKLATDAGWGDGLPVFSPTEERVREWCSASKRFPEELLAELPPRNGRCTVEKVAINAVLAGAPANAMPLLCAAVEAMADPEFNLFALNTTTSCVVPGVFVNGPARDELGIPYGPGCFGGAAGPSPAIGRALRLLMRNVGGQVVGESSKSVFGQPGRVTGIVVGEWEERSPWAPLSERRGIAAGTNALTVHGCTGTLDVADIVADGGRDLLAIIGTSLAVLGTNAFIGSHHGAQLMIAIAPPWADLIASTFLDLDDVRRELWRHAALPLAMWPHAHRAALHANGRVDDDGVVHVVDSPDELLVIVCGGLGNLHALALHSFGPTRAVTRAF